MASGPYGYSYERDFKWKDLRKEHQDLITKAGPRYYSGFSKGGTYKGSMLEDILNDAKAQGGKPKAKPPVTPPTAPPPPPGGGGGGTPVAPPGGGGTGPVSMGGDFGGEGMANSQTISGMSRFRQGIGQRNPPMESQSLAALRKIY